MTIHARRRPTPARRARAIAALALVSAAGACASLDPRPDIDRAAATVGDRSGTTPVWSEAWEASLSAWDGHAPLRIDQALAMALRNNRQIRAEVEQIAAARADLVQAGLLPNPVLSLTLRFPFDPAGGGTFVGASVVQSFTALWLRGGRIDSADARLNQAVLDVSDKALLLVAQVRATHARIAFGQRAVALSDEHLATLARSIDSLEARTRAGEGTPLDGNRARLQLAKARAERAGEANELAKERRRMLELIGFANASTEWTAEDDATPTALPAIDEAAAATLALSQRLDVAAACAVAVAQRADLSVQERSRLSDLALGADLERDGGGGKSIGPVVEVAVPIFDTNAAQIARAGSLARAALASYEAATQRAVREARVAWIDLDSAARLSDEYRAALLALAEHNLTLAESALKSGQTDVTVLLEAQRELIDARRTLSGLELRATLARIALEQAVGGKLP